MQKGCIVVCLICIGIEKYLAIFYIVLTLNLVIMKIENKNFQTNGQISILQFQTLSLKLWDFYPGGPAIEKGDLVIEELDEEGTIEELRAINSTNKYLFLWIRISLSEPNKTVF